VVESVWIKVGPSEVPAIGGMKRVPSVLVAVTGRDDEVAWSVEGEGSSLDIATAEVVRHLRLLG
jgi:hypothetical protein